MDERARSAIWTGVVAVAVAGMAAGLMAAGGLAMAEERALVGELCDGWQKAAQMWRTVGEMEQELEERATAMELGVTVRTRPEQARQRQHEAERRAARWCAVEQEFAKWWSGQAERATAAGGDAMGEDSEGWGQ